MKILLLPSQNGAGDNKAVVINTGSLTRCRQKQTLVQGIIFFTRIPVLERGDDGG